METRANLTWRETQKQAANLGLAPAPDEEILQALKEVELCDSGGQSAHKFSDEKAQEARQWLNGLVIVYVLSTEGSGVPPEVLARLANLSLAVEVITEEDDLAQGALHSYNLDAARHVTSPIARALESTLEPRAARAARHLAALRHAGAGHHHGSSPMTPAPLVLVLEAEALLDEDFAPKLKHLLNSEAPCDWAAIALGMRGPYGTCVTLHLARVEPDGNEPEERCRRGVSSGTLVTLYRMSELEHVWHVLSRTVWDAARPQCLDVDVALAALSGELAYYAVPDSSSLNFAHQAALSHEQAIAGDMRGHLIEVCNAEAVLPGPVTPRKFHLSSHYQKICMKDVPHRNMMDPFEIFTEWEGRNWCWTWMKNVVCYPDRGHSTWRAAQDYTNSLGLAPPAMNVLFDGIANPNQCDLKQLGEAEEFDRAEEREAYRWLNATLSVYVLNLPTQVTRWERITDHLTKLGIGHKRIFGVNLTVENAWRDTVAEGLIPPHFDFDEAQRQAYAYYNRMGGITGTVGCASAHMRAAQTVLADAALPGARPVALVLEDDVFLADDFAVRLYRLLRTEAPCDWQAISLKSRCPYGECISPHLTRVQPDGNEPADRCRHGVNYGFFAMLYRVSELAELHRLHVKTVWDESRPHCLDVDVALASISDQVAYYAVPSVQEPGFLEEGSEGSTRMQNNAFQMGANGNPEGDRNEETPPAPSPRAP